MSNLRPFDPRAELRHRCRVYRFGARWHWKCREPQCQRGGTLHTQEDAMNRAMCHCLHQGAEVDCHPGGPAGG
jgi:hypothetical protein